MKNYQKSECETNYNYSILTTIVRILGKMRAALKNNFSHDVRKIRRRSSGKKRENF